MVKNSIKLAGLIPAAGLGRRIGKPKWQLKSNGRTFLETITEKLINAGIADIFCTYRTGLKPAVENIKYILNEKPDEGMFSSIFYGSKSLFDFDGAFIWPVDHPDVNTETIELLIQRFAESPSASYKPAFHGRGGHPIVLSKDALSNIMNSEPGYCGGLRQLLKDRSIGIIKVGCNDPLILKNINTPSDI